jgi:RNA polymerase sigma-70 factor, ECF subfamily
MTPRGPAVGPSTRSHQVFLLRIHALQTPLTASEPRPERIEPQLSDEELVERLIEGDSWAQEALYRRYVRMVWATALRLLGNRADAEDIVQDTFATALTDLPHLEQAAAVRGWLLRITVHQAHRRFRRRALLRRLGLDHSVDDATLAALTHPGASPETLAELSRVDRALGRLESGERFAWILRYVDGHRLEDVATACQCSLATIKRRLARANRAVDEALGEARPREEAT